MWIGKKFVSLHPKTTSSQAEVGLADSAYRPGATPNPWSPPYNNNDNAHQMTRPAATQLRRHGRTEKQRMPAGTDTQGVGRSPCALNKYNYINAGRLELLCRIHLKLKSKLKIKMNKPTQILFTFLALTLFCACTKEKTERIQPCKNDLTDIPYFSTKEEFLQEIDIIRQLNGIEAIQKHESNRGWRSIGSLADDFYASLLPETFKSEDDLITLLQENQIFLDTIVDDDGEIAIYPKWADNIHRYVANESGLFRVGDYVSRIFKFGTVTTSIDNLDKLLNVSEEDAYNSDTLLFSIGAKALFSHYPHIIPNHPQCKTRLRYPKSTIQKIQRNGDDRVTMQLISRFSSPGGGGEVTTDVRVTSEHKWLWWWADRHSLKCWGSVDIHVQTGLDTWKTHHIKINKDESPVFVLNCFVFNTAIGDYRNYDCYHYWAYNLSAKSPCAGPARLVHTH